MLRPIKYIVLFVGICIGGVGGSLAHGQGVTSTKPLWKVYKQARKAYLQGNYIGCQSALKPLLDKHTAFTPYSWFYHGLSAYQQGLLEEAETTFLHILGYYPSWDQQDEILYWLARIYLKKDDYISAFNYLEKIRNKSQFELDSLVAPYVYKLHEGGLLATLRRLYPTNLVIARAWFYQQLHLPYVDRDVLGVHQVVRLLGLPDSFVCPLRRLHSIKKETYHIALLFPFFLAEVGPKVDAANRLMLDIYSGMQAAVDRLYQQGIAVVLHPYDTKNDIAVTKALLERQELKGMDLLVGPIAEEIMPLVAEFALANQILVFDPLSIHASTVANNPFVYLLKPSLPRQVRAAADFTSHKLGMEEAYIGVVYGAHVEDSIRAHLYQQYIEDGTGRKVDLMLELDDTDAKKFLNRFRFNQQGSKEVLDKLGFIYVASQDELVIANVVSTLQIRKLRPVVLLDEVAIKKDLVTIDQLQQLPLFFVAPDYIDYTKTSLYNWRVDFYDRFGLYPSYYASVGYDGMLFMAKMLFEQGVYFPAAWPDTVQRGAIFSGFYYGLSHDNQVVPIIQLRDKQWVVYNNLYASPLP